MKPISHMLVALLVVIAFALPSEVRAQNFCEDFTTILKGITQRSEREELEFITLPGARCELSTSRTSFTCDWLRPHSGASGAPFLHWMRKVMNEAKALAGAFRKCIRDDKVPFVWRTFRKKKVRGLVSAYYVYNRGNPKVSVVFCARVSDYNLSDDKKYEGASLRLRVRKGHKRYC